MDTSYPGLLDIRSDKVASVNHILSVLLTLSEQRPQGWGFNSDTRPTIRIFWERVLPDFTQQDPHGAVVAAGLVPMVP